MLLLSLSSQDVSTNRHVLFSRLLKEFQHGIAIATLLRLRGRDGCVAAAT